MNDDPLNGLPHTYPFRFLDKVLSISSEKGVAIKNVTVNEPFFDGHFKGDPVVPGVIIVEAMAQLAGLVMNHGVQGAGAYLARIKDVKFKKLVVPGDTLTIDAVSGERVLSFANFTVTARVGGAVAAEGEIIMSRTE